MSQTNKKNAKQKKSFPYLPVVLALIGLGVLLTAGGFTFAATQEQHDTFCASCHTQPEIDILRALHGGPTHRSGFLPHRQENQLH